MDMHRSFFLLLLLLAACQGQDQQPPRLEVITPSQGPKLDAIAREKRPAQEVLPFADSNWVEVQALEPSIRKDIRYATDNNFVEQVLYPCGRCFLRRPVAEALAQVHQNLQQKGLGLLVFDCYRPLDIQWKMWEIMPDARYVSDPRKGSMHNRGAAVDLTLVNTQGQLLPMGTEYDFFGREAWPEYTDLPEAVLQNRRLLQTSMEQAGFKGIRTEWWHFSYTSGHFAIEEKVWPCQN